MSHLVCDIAKKISFRPALREPPAPAARVRLRANTKNGDRTNPDRVSACMAKRPVHKSQKDLGPSYVRRHTYKFPVNPTTW